MTVLRLVIVVVAEVALITVVEVVAVEVGVLISPIPRR